MGLNEKEIIYIKCLYLFGSVCNSIKLNKTKLIKNNIINKNMELTDKGKKIAKSINNIDEVIAK